MNIEVLTEVKLIIENTLLEGPKWKPGRDIEHLAKRIRRGHVPKDWTLVDYNSKILEILRESSTSVFLHYQGTFEQKYYVFGDNEWIVIIGANQIIDTAFPPDYYVSYLQEEKGYKYLGTIEEVLKNG